MTASSSKRRAENKRNQGRGPCATFSGPSAKSTIQAPPGMAAPLQEGLVGPAMSLVPRPPGSPGEKKATLSVAAGEGSLREGKGYAAWRGVRGACARVSVPTWSSHYTVWLRSLSVSSCRMGSRLWERTLQGSAGPRIPWGSWNEAAVIPAPAPETQISQVFANPKVGGLARAHLPVRQGST